MRVPAVAVLMVACAGTLGCWGRRPPAGGTGDSGGAVRCATDADCRSGPCRDGVCCATTCPGSCTSCAAFFTGRTDGTCAPVKAGLDPHDDCNDEGGASRCGNDGRCDGAGACRKAVRGTSCTPAGCVDTQTFRAEATCDGAGSCIAGPETDCGAFACTAAGCATPCASDGDCPTGSRCAEGTCRVRKPNGQPCGLATECASGVCAPEGVCCDQACAGGCSACLRKATGLPDGTCAAVILGLDPKDHCPPELPATCGRDGTCDGAGACRLHGAQTACGVGQCTAGQFTAARTCDGTGACAPPRPPVDCGRNACTRDGCSVTCSSDDDCDGESYCLLARGTCAARQPVGNACLSARECVSGSCVDGFCCQSSCADRCHACATVKTGGPSGLCLPIREGTDPDAECDSTAPDTCGTDGTCDGGGRCRRWADQTICAAGICDGGGHYVSARTCADGVCRPPQIETCGLANCSDAVGCLHACTASDDCLGTNYCNSANHTCAAQKVLGAACAANGDCLSGFCADGVCCNVRCTESCVSCLARDTGLPVDGTCGEVQDGTDPAGECQPDGSACGRDGFCGGGRCRLAPTSTLCQPRACVDEAGGATTTFTAASYCDGTGVCPAVVPDPCPGAVRCLSASECRSEVCGGDEDCVEGLSCQGGACTTVNATRALDRRRVR